MDNEAKLYQEEATMNDHTDSPSDTIETPEAPARPAAAHRTAGRWKRLALAGIGLYAATVLVTGIYWSLQPPTFDVRAVALDRVGGDASRLAPGVVAASTVSQVARTLLEKPGGFLHNDLSMPSIYLDNMPNWEYGVLKEVRDSLRAVRNDFSRSQTQSVESLDLRKAEEFLNYDADSWILPSTESEFREGILALDSYLSALIAGEDRSARFFTRADNLAAYLQVVEKRLGSYAQRLSASVGDSELTAALVAGSEATPPAAGTPEVRIRTPWLEIDDIYYEARGYSWALLHMFKALAIEFEPVLGDKNAKVSLQQVIRDLEGATARMWSPMVLNGHGFGFVANHSLILASYIARANTAVLDLRILLQQG
jgi:hypothetical protein